MKCVAQVNEEKLVMYFHIHDMLEVIQMKDEYVDYSMWETRKNLMVMIKSFPLGLISFGMFVCV